MQALSNLAPHLVQLQMLALWGRLGSLEWVSWLENHTKTKSSGVQYQAECCYEQDDSSQARHSPFFLYNRHAITLCLVSDHKNRGQKIR